jgi:DNA-binding response OmpR family regulator
MSGTAAVLGHVSPIMTQTTLPTFQFGEFEADLAERKLYRNGEAVEIQAKAFGFLPHCLKERETVSRREIAAEL